MVRSELPPLTKLGMRGFIKPSDSAQRKTASKTTPERLPVQSMADMLGHLGSLTSDGLVSHPTATAGCVRVPETRV